MAISASHPTFNCIATDVDNLDLTDAAAVSNFIAAHAIHYIINCAAYTAVDRAESDPETCNLINCNAVRNLAIAADAARAKVLHISTDYVFDGLSSFPYIETAPTAPQSVYGKSKLAGEEILFQHCPESIVIRTAWLYSAFGNNFVKTMLRLARERSDLNVVCDQRGAPTYAADLAQALFTILHQTEQTGQFLRGLYHYSNEGETTWFDFTQKILQIARITTCTVHPIPTSEYPTPAPRPPYSVLDKTKIKTAFPALRIPLWESSLSCCMTRIQQS